MRLKSRNEFPPNGWQYYQAETGWSSDPYMGFSDVVKQIIAHRQANPRFNLATDAPTVENALEQYTVSRLLSINGGRDYLLDDGGAPPPSFPSRRPLRERVADAAGSARRIVIGIATLKDWLGDGLKPVEHTEAERRASLCVRCPNNLPGSHLVDAAAETFRRLVAAKNDMKLVTAHDEKLETCAACSCRLTLKVWAPMAHILKHTDAEVRAKLWSECWITPL
jgi:hypothetical protein